jgi:hypothetical protein
MAPHYGFSKVWTKGSISQRVIKMNETWREVICHTVVESQNFSDNQDWFLIFHKQVNWKSEKLGWLIKIKSGSLFSGSIKLIWFWELYKKWHQMVYRNMACESEGLVF